MNKITRFVQGTNIIEIRNYKASIYCCISQQYVLRNATIMQARQFLGLDNNQLFKETNNEKR